MYYEHWKKKFYFLFRQCVLSKKKKETKTGKKNKVDTYAEEHLQSAIYNARHFVIKWNILNII